MEPITTCPSLLCLVLLDLETTDNGIRKDLSTHAHTTVLDCGDTIAAAAVVTLATSRGSGLGGQIDERDSARATNERATEATATANDAFGFSMCHFR